VDEIPEGPGEALVVPWWEALPSPQKLADGVMARAGDTVTVALRRTARTRWAVTIVDRTNGDAFATDIVYSGPLTSAEWIVEANSDLNGTSTSLAPYKPCVTFSRLTASDTGVRPSGRTSRSSGQTEPVLSFNVVSRRLRSTLPEDVRGSDSTMKISSGIMFAGRRVARPSKSSWVGISRAAST
jgi:Peptidase A4 family